MSIAVTQSSIPINRIKNGPNTLRLDLGEDSEEMKDLVASIKADGILEPVGVYESGDGYVLIYGNRRLHAAKEAGLTVVPVVIRPAPSNDTELLALQLQENEHRVCLEPVAFGEALKRLQEKLGCTQAHLASMVRMNPVRLSRLIALANLPDPIKALVAEKRLPHSTALELAQLDIAEQTEFILRALNGHVTREEVTTHKQARAGKREADSRTRRITLQLDFQRTVVLIGVEPTTEAAKAAHRDAISVLRKAEQNRHSLVTCIRSQADRFKTEFRPSVDSEAAVNAKQET